MQFIEAKKKIEISLLPYKEQLIIKSKSQDILSKIVDIFRSQPANHINILINEAVAELRDRCPSHDKIDPDFVDNLIEKYKKKAQKIVNQFS